MRALAVACLALLAAVSPALIAPPPAAAADAPIGGSWVATCPEASLSGFVLHARCRDTGGALQDTTLDLLTCGQPATATNVNGQLACESGPRHPGVGGSWAGSCGNERLIDRQLTALCLDTAGVKHSAALNLAACAEPQTAMNQNGQLVCEHSLPVATTSRTMTLTPAVNGQPPVVTREVIVRTDPPADTTAAGGTAAGNLATGSASPRPGQFGAGALPVVGGSWSATCTSSTLGLDLVFSATCKAPDGSTHQSSLRITNCAQPARIANINGTVACENGPRVVQVSGAWSSSCIEDSLAGPVLTATCVTAAGIAMVSSLDLSRCRTPTLVENSNGKLACVPRQAAVANVAASSGVTIAAPVSPGVSGVAGTWDMTTETGVHFALPLAETGGSIVGQGEVGGSHFEIAAQLLPNVRHFILNWQVASATTSLSGNGTMELSADGSTLAVRLLFQGADASGGQWSGTRAVASEGVAAAGGTVVLPGFGAPGAVPDGFVGATVTRTVSVRTQPKLSGSTVLRSLAPGTEVSVKCQGNWCQLSTGNEFVSKGYLTLHPAVATNSVAANGSSTATQRIAAVEQSASLPPGVLPCSQRVSSRSIGSTDAVTIMFHSTSAASRTLNWVDRDGKNVFYANVAPGKTVAQPTFARDIWELTDDSGGCVLLFIAGSSASQTVDVP